MKTIKIFIILVSVVWASACTNLDEKLYDKVTSADYGKTPAEIETIVGSAYAALRGFRQDVVYGYPTGEFLLFLNETTSDEACIPTRGQHWYDEGRYQQAQFHTWDAQNFMILSSWKYCYEGIGKVNAIIYQVDKSELSEEAKNVVKAELRGLRAYFYYVLLDYFGNVPIITSFEDTELPANSTRADVYTFVENEILEVLELLPSEILYGRFTQNVAYTLLGRLYLNSEVYIGEPRWQDCIDACEKVNGHALESNYFTNFLNENEGSMENIWVIPYDHKAGTVGNFFPSLSMHYKQKQAISATKNYADCVNGICLQPGTYSAFEETDIRRLGFLEGDQIDKATGSVIIMDEGTPLTYTEEILDYTNALSNEGVRIAKYELKEGDVWERDHDFVLMRFAEVLMMKAECLYRLGQTDQSRILVEQIRARAKVTTPATIDLDFINDELKREFTMEGRRRTDNIRFGTFFKPWWNKETTPEYRGIFPIPQYELDLNSSLVQNPGY